MLTITVDDAGLRHYLQRLQGRLDDLTPAMAGVGMELESRVSRRFETRTDPLGHAWHPWATSTKASYPHPGSAEAKAAGRPGNARLLDRYGDMLGGLSHSADASSVRIGFDKAYAAFHEFGTRRMPRRGLLFADPTAGTLAPDDERAVIDILSEFLTDD